MRLPTGVDADALLRTSQERHRLSFLPGTVCAAPAAGGAAGDAHGDCAGYIRLCFAYEEPAALVDGVARLSSAVRDVLDGHGGPGD